MFSPCLDPAAQFQAWQDAFAREVSRVYPKFQGWPQTEAQGLADELAAWTSLQHGLAAHFDVAVRVEHERVTCQLTAKSPEADAWVRGRG